MTARRAVLDAFEDVWYSTWFRLWVFSTTLIISVVLLVQGVTS